MAKPEDEKKMLELEKLRIDLERAQLDLAQAKRREVEAQSDPAAHCLYTFYGEVNQENVKACLAELGRISRQHPKQPITIIFNSPGGSVSDGLCLYDYIMQLRKAGHRITTVALGRAASMGGVLLQAGDKRVIGANAFLLIHEVSSGTYGKVSMMDDSIEYAKRLQDRLIAILANRSTLRPAQIRRQWARKDWWLDAKEAVRLGFADEID